jgi:hypothetical protein
MEYCLLVFNDLIFYLRLIGLMQDMNLDNFGTSQH